MASGMESSTSCSFCGHEGPRPLLICFKCSEGTNIDGIITPTHYCGTTCRNADKIPHEEACKLRNDRKCIYRAGDLLQAVFYEWRETAFDIKVTKAWKRDGILCFLEDTYEPWDPVHFEFPNHLFENAQDKEKMLSANACTDSLFNLNELTQRVLEGMKEQFVQHAEVKRS